MGQHTSEFSNRKPSTLSVGPHESPMGLLAGIADEIPDLSDFFPRNLDMYKWSPSELIIWT